MTLRAQGTKRHEVQSPNYELQVSVLIRESAAYAFKYLARGAIKRFFAYAQNDTPADKSPNYKVSVPIR